MNLQRRAVALLLVEFGEIHDGIGLSDSGPPGSIDAHDICIWLTLLLLGTVLLEIGNSSRIRVSSLDTSTWPIE